jgi:hypothetical protein
MELRHWATFHKALEAADTIPSNHLLLIFLSNSTECELVARRRPSPLILLERKQIQLIVGKLGILPSSDEDLSSSLAADVWIGQPPDQSPALFRLATRLLVTLAVADQQFVNAGL